MKARLLYLLPLLECGFERVSSQIETMFYHEPEPPAGFFEVNWTADVGSTSQAEDHNSWKEPQSAENINPKPVARLLPLFSSRPRADADSKDGEAHTPKLFCSKETADSYVMGVNDHLDNRKQEGLSYLETSPENVKPPAAPRLLRPFPTRLRGDVNSISKGGESHASKRLRMTETSDKILGAEAHLDNRKQEGLSYRITAGTLTGAPQNPIDQSGLTASENERVLSAPRGVYLLSHENLLGRLRLAGHGPGRDDSTFSHSNSSPMQPFKKLASSMVRTSIGKQVEAGNSPLSDTWLRWRRDEEVSKDYSCLMLDWSPPVVDLKVSYATHFIAKEFLEAITQVLPRNCLVQMHDSHQILVPFVYKLMEKQLKVDHWPRAILVWRLLWFHLHRDTPQLNQDEHQVLKMFLWISDFMSELTLPQCYDNRKRFSHYVHSTAEVKTLKILSNGNKELIKLRPEEQHALCDIVRILRKECTQGNGKTDFQAQQRSKAEILNHLRSKAQLIYSGTEKELLEANAYESLRSYHSWHELQYQKSHWKGYNYLSTYPKSIRSRIHTIYSEFELETRESRPTLNALERPETHFFELLKEFDKVLPITPHTNDLEGSQESSHLLRPQVIHNFFADRLHQIEGIEER
ncbi:hypothetical protein MJO29_008649 [Puccinia striiformis f. sp. tritici]|nr:hypothetical protein Pst134EA_015189 [Puccinia striiformis f. sp. tritici]KAH9463103.1 hypothetical protein Pst134EA_015189 [Puccinia striiformis f. sp. tritici]KAI7953018.1 hypothetical protein MJO29_008649 [Puccinia striiformis f. sp. tritici]